MGLIRESSLEEKDLRNITPLALALLILELLREKADESGRVICAPTFSEFLLNGLLTKGYVFTGSNFYYRYNPAIAILYKYRLAVRVSNKSGIKPAIYHVDMTSSYEEARELNRKLQKFLCSDLKERSESPSIDNVVASEVIAGFQAQITHLENVIKTKDQTIEYQQQEISRLQGLIIYTLQEAEKFAQDTRKRLKQS